MWSRSPRGNPNGNREDPLTVYRAEVARRSGAKRWRRSSLIARHGSVAISSRGRLSRAEFLTRKNALLFWFTVPRSAHGIEFSSSLLRS
jgi:hypothetical protein